MSCTSSTNTKLVREIDHATCLRGCVAVQSAGAGEHICHAMSTVRLVSLLRARLWSFQPVPFRIHSRGPVISTTSALYTLHSPLNCWSGPGLLHVQMPRAASRSQGPLCTLSRPHPVSRLQTLQKAHCPSCLCPDSVPGLGKVTCD